MKALLTRSAERLRESYWFVPSLMAVAAMLLAGALIWLDSHQETLWMDRLPWLYAARPDGARSLMSSIGGSMIGVAGTTFSVTIAAVVYASGQYGPRLLSNFMADRGNQVTLGTFIATFVYSLIVVRTIRSPGETPGAEGFVPQLAVLVGLLLALCSTAVLIYFIHHVPSRIHINSVIERIGDRLLAEIIDKFPFLDGGRPAARDQDASIPAALSAGTSDTETARRAKVLATQTGYIQLVDKSVLVETAASANLVLRLVHTAGDFAHDATVLLEVASAGAFEASCADQLRSAFVIGSRRTPSQDLNFLIDELVEIAARALSPGINDPFTAKSCLDWLGAALAELARRDMPARLHSDDEGRLRLITRPASFEDYVARGLGALAQYVSSDVIAARHFLVTIGEVATSCDTASRIMALMNQVGNLRELSDSALTGANRRVVLDEADRMLRALNAPDYRQRLRDNSFD